MRSNVSVVKYSRQSCSFRGDRIQWNLLGQTAASKCKGLPTRRQVTLSPSSGCAEDGDRVHILTRLSAQVNLILSPSVFRGVA